MNDQTRELRWLCKWVRNSFKLHWYRAEMEIILNFDGLALTIWECQVFIEIRLSTWYHIYGKAALTASSNW